MQLLLQYCQSFDIPTPDNIHQYMCNNPKLPSPYKNGWEFKALISVDFIFLSFGIMGFIVELWNYKRVTDEA